ncbi:MAG TPA: ABC transporter permease [Terriglobales bacterium]|nr:ABC transporter permease [Terriglobales bacterium]HYL65464.1 ABC transporter permease [Candidatus Methylomirabilis sp.]
MTDFLREVRLTFRRLARRPGFALVVVGTLALGIGANTAIFSVVNTVLLRPLPYPSPERLVMIWGKDATRGISETRVSYPDFRDWREASKSFETLAAFWAFPNGDVNLTGGAEPERVPVARVTSGFFEVMGVRLAHGRSFLPEENIAGKHRVAILSHALWQRRFGGDPSLVGRAVQVNGFPYTVVGILASEFRAPGMLAFGERVDLWRPLVPDDNQTGGRGSRNLRVVGRLKPGVSVETARQELLTITSGMEQTYPDTNKGWSVNLIPLREQVVRQSRPALLVLLGAVTLVLLIACTNVANMLLARASDRRGEVAVRRALGAPRRAIVGPILTESVLLATIGGIAGVLLAHGGIKLLVWLAPSRLPRLDEIVVDTPVLLFAFLVSVTAGFLFGLAPVLNASSVDLISGLRHGSRGRGVAPGRRLRQALVLSELTLTFVLLVGAGLLMRSFKELLGVDPGFEPERLLTLQIELPMGTKYTKQEQRTTFFDELLQRVQRFPEVRSITMVNSPPLGERDFTTSFSVVGELNDPSAPAADVQLVGPEYFRTLGIPLIAGRRFTERDGKQAPRVAIVNETAARRWSGSRAIGGRFKVGFELEAEVVGVVRDVRNKGFDAAVPPIIYVPSEQLAYNFMTVVVRTSTSAPRALVPAIRAAVRDLDSEQPIYNVRTMDELISASVAERRFQMLLLAGFAGMALVLALAGVYGVMSYTVGQRTQEIGVRMALGAEPRDVLRSVVRESLTLALIATAIGVPASLIVARLLSASLFGVGPSDPWIYVGTLVVIIATAIVSAYAPARRAAAVDPAIALRTE